MEESHPASGESVRINGKNQPWRPDWTVTDLLKELDAAGPGVAVERNLEVVRRQKFASTVIQPGDTLEVVRLVGGG
ncbi:MAG: sulfur carrier protein ThiS [Planctomycetota bacterium]|nr:sulfur carrier protein ThiS [Planctomycetota bacterium]